MNADNLGGSFDRKPTDEAHRQVLSEKMSQFVAMLNAKYAGIEVEEEEGWLEEERGAFESQNSLEAPPAVEDPSDEET